MIRDRRTERDRRSHAPEGPEVELAEPASYGEDWAGDDRRTVTDRRFSSTPFDPVKAEFIRKRIEQTGTLGHCPLCNNDLTLGEPIETAAGPKREVRCQTCWRSVAVRIV